MGPRDILGTAGVTAYPIHGRVVHDGQGERGAGVGLVRMGTHQPHGQDGQEEAGQHRRHHAGLGGLRRSCGAGGTLLPAGTVLYGPAAAPRHLFNHGAVCSGVKQ